MHCLQKPSFGSGVLLQNAHLLAASASALVGFPNGCGWRHSLHKRSMPRHTISNQASGCHKLLLVKSRNGRRPCSPLAFGVHPRTKEKGLRIALPLHLLLLELAFGVRQGQRLPMHCEERIGAY